MCPLIEDSDSETLEGVDSVETTYKKLTEWFKPYPEVTIKAISGDMKAKEVQEGIEAFAQNQANILISTTIVEVGVNVPNATVIVIGTLRIGTAASAQRACWTQQLAELLCASI